MAERKKKVKHEFKKKADLLALFKSVSGKTEIVEPMKRIHGTLRDKDAIEREVALIMREILDLGFFRTKLTPRQLAGLICSYYEGHNDTEIARELGDEKLSKTVARARVRLKLFRDHDFNLPFDRQKMVELVEEGLTMKEVSEELKVSPSTLREYRHVIEQEQDQTLEPFINRIRDVMEDRDLTGKMTIGLSQDGLADTMDATEAELADLT